MNILQKGGSALRDILNFFVLGFTTKEGLLVILLVLSIHFFLVWKYHSRHTKFIVLSVLLVAIFVMFAIYKWMTDNDEGNEGNEE